MARRHTGRGGYLIAGLGLGVAAGVVIGTLVIAPNVPGFEQQETPPPAAAPKPEEKDEGLSQNEDDAVGALGPALVAGSLKDRPVLVVRFADADTDSTDQLRELTGHAGAIDAGQIVLTDKFFDKDQADELRSNAANSLPAGATLSPDATGAGTHAGELLAAALLLSPESGEPEATTEDRKLVLTSLREAGFIDFEDGTIRPTQGVLFATGDTVDAAAEADFFEAFKKAGAAAVVTGPKDSAADGVIKRLRDDKSEVSTVDTAEQSWARVSAVLALVEQFGGGSGAYGVAGNAEGTVPAPGNE